MSAASPASTSSTTVDSQATLSTNHALAGLSIFTVSSGQLCIPGNCVINSLYNQQYHYAPKGLNLQVRLVSLGFGTGTKVHWEFGGPTYTSLIDFVRGKPEGHFDGHMCLMQPSTTGDPLDDRLYDVLYANMWHCMQLWGVEQSVKVQRPISENQRPAAHVIEGQTVRELATLGLHYQTCSEFTTQLLLARHEKTFGTVLNALGLSAKGLKF